MLGVEGRRGLRGNLKMGRTCGWARSTSAGACVGREHVQNVSGVMSSVRI